MPLTDITCSATKPRSGRRKLSDGAGLQLWIMPSGARLWRFIYRYLGKQKVWAMGSYPKVSLTDARALRDEARKLLDAGIDPGAQKRIDMLGKALQAANTFQAVAEYIVKKTHEGLAQVTLAKARWLLSLPAPKIGLCPIVGIAVPELLAALRAVEQQGILATARRMIACIGLNGDAALGPQLVVVRDQAHPA